MSLYLPGDAGPAGEVVLLHLLQREVPEMRKNAALIVEQRRRIVSCELQLLPVLLADNEGFLGRQPVMQKVDKVRLGWL